MLSINIVLVKSSYHYIEYLLRDIFSQDYADIEKFINENITTIVKHDEIDFLSNKYLEKERLIILIV